MDETKKKKPEEEQEKSQGSVEGEENTEAEKNKGSEEKSEEKPSDEKPADENSEGAKADEKPNEEIEKLKAENLRFVKDYTAFCHCNLSIPLILWVKLNVAIPYQSFCFLLSYGYEFSS